MDIKKIEDFLTERIPSGEELLERPIDSKEDFKRWIQQLRAWQAYNSEWIGIALEYGEKAKYDARIYPLSPNVNWQFEHEWIIKEGYIQNQITVLRSIEARVPLWAAQQRENEQKAAMQREADQQAARERQAQEAAAREASREADRLKRLADAPIFIVHGSDTTRAQIVARAVERATNREVIILREQPNAGRTIIEKFEDHAQEASYAIVLITADDRGGRANESSQPRGRQNVIFEMGYFYGRIGRKRVSVLLDPGVEQPSDMSGIVYIDFGNANVWKSELFREMHHAGFQIDWSRIPS